MDHRIEKTKRSICSAFIGIRAKKPLERLTVKELCEAAQINKSTFYAHYDDVYDLSDRIESEIVSTIIRELENAQSVFDDPRGFTKNLFEAYSAQISLITIIFSGSRSEQFPKKVACALKETLFEKRPELSEDPEMNALLTYSVYGGYFAYKDHLKFGERKIAEIIGDFSERLMK